MVTSIEQPPKIAAPVRSLKEYFRMALNEARILASPRVCREGEVELSPG